MIGEPITRIIPPDRLKEEELALQQVRAGSRVDHSDTVRRTKDGALIDISLTVSPIRNAAGHVIGASKIARDIRQRKQAELAAFRLASIIESAQDAIASKDRNGIVTSWNTAAERLFGFTAADMIGQPITKIIPKDRLREEDYILSQVRAGLRVEHFETKGQHQSGRLFDVSLAISPIRDAAGGIIGASKIARDITEHNRLLEVERRAVAREEAARRELLEAENRRIQEASRLKTVFVANMSH